MNQHDTAHAWWSRLRHQGLLLSPVVMLERFPHTPEPAPFHKMARLRDAYNRFVSTADARHGEVELNQAAILGWVDSLLEHYVGHEQKRLARKQNIPEKLTAVLRIGSRSDTIKPHRVVFADAEGTIPALLVMADTSHTVGRGRGQTAYARFLELLRGTGHRLGLLTNGHQFRLIYAGLDFESWCEWESDRWFDDSDGTEELNGLRQLLSPDSVGQALLPAGEKGQTRVSGLLDAVEESRKRQADLSSVLRENVRQGVELLLDEVSSTNRTEKNLFAGLVAASSDRPLTDAEAYEALLQATVRVVMRLVVCLFAESRQLLPVNDPIYSHSYGVRSLYELLEETTRNDGGTHGLLNRNMAWPRLMSLFRLIYDGSAHGAFPMRPYGGVLFRPGNDKSEEPVARALHILEHSVGVCDATIYHVLRKLLRGPLPALRGRIKTFVEGPVDYTDLRTEFIGLIYEGILDYRLKRTDEKIGPQVFLNLGREPVLPLARLEDMLANDKKALKDLLTTLRKEKVTASAATEEEETEDKETEEPEDTEEAAPVEEAAVEVESTAETEGRRAVDFLDAVESAKCWAREAVVLAGLVRKQGKKESDSQYQQEVDTVATKLINRVVATGEFYLVRAGNTRKGTGTFYTRPQLAVPTVHRTLEPLCYEKGKDGTLIPKEPEVILGLKVCDSSCGSASFLVAALHYMTDALYKSLCHHRKLDDPVQAKKLTLPYGRLRAAKNEEELVPFPPNDPQRGETFTDRIKALLRRHVVERCIYGVDINPLAVEFARVSLWVETLDPELPFSFLDHKIKVGNSLVGRWLDRVLDYPLKAWEREGGDGKDGPRTQRIEELLRGEKIGNRRTGDGRIKQEMRLVVESRFGGQRALFGDTDITPELVIAAARAQFEKLHDLPNDDPDERERYFREHVQASKPFQALKSAMDEWCAVWFWPADEASLRHAPMPHNLYAGEELSADTTIAVAGHVRFFHWELEFPDVFTPLRSGFDAMIGNPPWDVMKPNSQEFFTEFDPLYRTYGKQEALRQQAKLFADIPGLRNQWDEYNARFKALANWVGNVVDPFDLALARGKDGDSLKFAWAQHRKKRLGFADSQHPFRLQGSADLNAYKMFAEVFWNLLRPPEPEALATDFRATGGRLGVILPTGIYSDFGTKALREELLFHGRLEFIYAFQNEKKIFVAADHRYKQTAMFATKGGRTESFLTRFRMGVGDSPTAQEMTADILYYPVGQALLPDQEGRLDGTGKSACPTGYMVFTPDEVRVNSPKTLSLVELRSQRDLDIFRKIYAHSIRIGEQAPGWEITYATEFHMTNDSKHFPPLAKWEERGYKPDVFGRWIGPEREVALPFYEGRMIGQFDFLTMSWVSGQGSASVWASLPFDAKSFRTKALIGEIAAKRFGNGYFGPKLEFRDIGRNTDTRTMISAVVPFAPCGHTISTLRLHGIDSALFISASMNSLCFDNVLRHRSTGTHQSWFIIEECPLPRTLGTDPYYGQLVISAARLTFIHRRFAPEWLRLKHLYPELGQTGVSGLPVKEWKHWWAVTEADRLRLRVEIDALCADLYGLEPDDFDWIVRDDPTDPKGFYRVDRKLPFRERLTGLAAAAFRALKEGKWGPVAHASGSSTLSNDEFFAIIGIPELTAGRAPLILKRDGCHLWEPEKFGTDDPRHGWTWKDCWNDAVALLGSEEAVQYYVEGKKEPAKEDGPKDRFGEPLPPRQRGLFE